MPEFAVNAHRFDPYKNFRFRVKWDGVYVAGVSKVSSLKHTVETMKHREGGAQSIQHIGPGLVSYEAITMERGVTWDTAFRDWAMKVWDVGELGQPSLKDFRKNISIELLNEQGTIVRLYNVFSAWVSEFEIQAELDANSGAYLMERIRVENEGVEIDAGVTEEMET